MEIFWVIWTIFALFATSSSARLTNEKEGSIPNDIDETSVKDRASLDEYLFSLIEGLRSRMHEGIPELNIPKLEPLKVNSIHIEQGGGVAKLKATFRNLVVHGLSNYTTNYAKSDPENYRFTLGFKYRELKIEGQYEINGNLLLVPISGQGDFWSILNSVTADSYNKIENVENELRLVRTQTDFDIGRMRIQLKNLFNGDNLLGDAVNGFLNEQSQEIIREIKPRLAKEIDAVILSVFEKALSQFPIEKWLKAIESNDA